MNKIDMHIHTNASDGILSPSTVIEWAVRLGMRGIAITDHDTTKGVIDALKTAKKHKNFIVIPGIEFSTFYKDMDIHILGYFIDYKNSDLIDMTDTIRNARIERAKKIIKKLKELRIDIENSEVFSTREYDLSIGRPHIARILVNKGYVDSIEEAFQKFLEKGKPAYVERFKLTIQEAIKIIQNANGIPVLAHPGLISKHVDITELIDKGIEGIEVYHTKHSEQDQEFYFKLAKQKSLFITGGSDFHDEIVGGVPEIGSVWVPYENIICMRDFLSREKF